MPPQFQLTPQALDDLDAIWSYIAEDNPSAADRVEQALFKAFHTLALHPLIGTQRRDVTPLPVRFWTVPAFPSYVVVYRPETRPLQIVTVLHASRDRTRILHPPPA